MQYNEALRVNPKSVDARFGYGMALVRLGRYREARDWFDDASRVNPDRPEFPYALARLLAAAPDDRVRDGQRAQAIVERLLQGGKTIDLGETMAMALAEVSMVPSTQTASAKVTARGKATATAPGILLEMLVASWQASAPTRPPAAEAVWSRISATKCLIRTATAMAARSAT